MCSCSFHNMNDKKYSYKVLSLNEEQVNSFSNDELLAAAVGSFILGEEGYDATMGKSIETFNNKYPNAPASSFSNDPKSIYVRDYVHMKDGSLNKKRMGLINECAKIKDFKEYPDGQRCVNDECSSQTVLMNTKIEDIQKFCKIKNNFIA